MNKVQKFAIAYVAFMVVAVYGYAVGRFQVFPYALLEGFVQDYEKFAEGDSMEKKTSVVAKLKNDLGGTASRWTYPYPEKAVVGAEFADFPTLKKRDEPPRIFVDEKHREGYRVIYGALTLEETFWGALLLNPQGEIIHSWDLSTAHINSGVRTEKLKNLYGVHLFPDGSVIYVMQERGGGIVKVDACGEVVWNLEGSFHHVVSPDEEGYFWSFTGRQNTRDQNMVKISIETGEIVNTIDMAEVRKANPDMHIWDFHRFKFEDRTEVYETAHLSHGNDIEPLPSALASDFPDFEVGDLVISYATTNLLFVLDPDTLEVKWWRAGIGDLQHDADWERGGTISILSNNPRSKRTSDIVTIDPKTMEHHVSVRGESYDFLTIVNGRHELTPYDTRFVTSAQQGWAFEVDSDGAIVFSFVNNVNSEESSAMHLSEAVRLKEDYFESPFWNNCK